jgi:hypothetical protein
MNTNTADTTTVTRDPDHACGQTTIGHAPDIDAHGDLLDAMT